MAVQSKGEGASRPFLVANRQQNFVGVTAIPVQQSSGLASTVSIISYLVLVLGRVDLPCLLPQFGSITAQLASVVQQITGRGIQLQPPSLVCFKVSCRVISTSRKKDVKIFQLRNISRAHMSSVEALKAEVHKQLGDSIVSKELKFDIGYMKGQTKVCFHSEDDLLEVWRTLEKGEACTLWCDGVQ